MRIGLILGCVAPFGWVVVQPGLLVFRRIRFEESDVAMVQAALAARREAES